jgi:ParB-like chromosome segregation protein Spo0J
MPKKKKSNPPLSKTYGEYHYTDLNPNPLNPRRIFDKFKLDVLEESIRANKILVPLTVYRDGNDNKLYILDGERRWRCAQRIEKGEVSTSLETLPTDLKVPEKLKESISYDSSEKELKGILSYETSANILIHHAPVSNEQYGLLASMSETKVWQSAVDELYETSKKKPPKEVKIPVNIVDPPDPTANMLYMFHVHNLREQWELMPTALSLQTIIEDLGVDDEDSLAELTKLSKRRVEDCKKLLNYPKKYQSMMMDPDPSERLKANLFIEMHAVLDLYQNLGKRVSAGKNRNELTDLFIEKHKEHLIRSVVHFRRILEAKDLLEETERWEDFKNAAYKFVKDEGSKLESLFNPLTVEERSIQDATGLCKEFLTKLRKLKLSHATTKRRELTSALKSVLKEVESLIESLSGEE